MTDPLSNENPFDDTSYGEIVAELNKRTIAADTNFEKVCAFHRAFNTGRKKRPPSSELRLNLIMEEVEEVSDELLDYDDAGNGYPKKLKDIDKKKLAKELADLLYVVYGTADEFGIDIDRVFSAVHESNMSKFGPDGKPVRREDGKILKGPNYKEADLSFMD